MDVVAELVAWVRSRPDCECEPGLSEAALRRAEEVYDVTFPPLWRAVLAEVHPLAGARGQRGRAWPRFPDWRRDDPRTRDRVEAPVEGLLFDVEHNNFWWAAWGPRPDSTAERLELAAARLRPVPRLVPLWIQWYVAATPGSPVFSVNQNDVVVMALTLPDLATGRDQQAVPVEGWPIGDVPFWSELHAWSQWGDSVERFAVLGTAGPHLPDQPPTS